MHLTLCARWVFAGDDAPGAVYSEISQWPTTTARELVQHCRRGWDAPWRWVGSRSRSKRSRAVSVALKRSRCCENWQIVHLFFDSTDGGAWPFSQLVKSFVRLCPLTSEATEKLTRSRTQQGLTDSSFLILRVVLHGRFLSSWSDLSGYFR